MSRTPATTAEPTVLTVDGAIDWLGGTISRAKLFQLLGSERIRSFKIDGRRVIRVSALEDFIADCEGTRGTTRERNPGSRSTVRRGPNDARAA